MKNTTNTTNPHVLAVGSIEHYKHFIGKYERVKEFADNASGELADKLSMELHGIAMILEEYEP